MEELPLPHPTVFKNMTFSYILLLFSLQRKSLRDQWLMEGAPLSPVSSDTQSPRSPLWGSEAQEMEEHIDQYSCRWVFHNHLKCVCVTFWLPRYSFYYQNWGHFCWSSQGWFGSSLRVLAEMVREGSWVMLYDVYEMFTKIQVQGCACMCASGCSQRVNDGLTKRRRNLWRTG